MSTSVTTHRVVGFGPGQIAVAAERHGDRIHFGALLKGGRTRGLIFKVIVPVLSVEDGAAWVASRIRGFSRFEGARESPLQAIQRKALAAQGRPYVNRLRSRLNTSARMELTMMFSGDSHHQAIPLDEVGQAPLLTLTRRGTVASLVVNTLVDASGDVWTRKAGAGYLRSLLGSPSKN